MNMIIKRLTAAVLCVLLVLSVLPMTVFADDLGYEAMALNTPVEVNITEESSRYKMFKYTCDSTGYYTFSATVVSGELAIQFDLYAEGEEWIDAVYSSQGYVELRSLLFKGATYYLLINAYDGLGSYEANVAFSESVHTAELALDSETIADVSASGERLFYEFTPEADGYYTLYATSEGIDNNVIAYSYTGKIIDEDDESGELSGSFAITVEMEAGKAYYFNVGLYDEFETGAFPIIIKKAFFPESISVQLDEEINAVYSGKNFYFNAKVNPGGAIGDVTWSVSDESIADIQYTHKDICMIEFLKTGTVEIIATSPCGVKGVLELQVKEIPQTVIKAGELAKVEEGVSDGYNRFIFTPEKDGEYTFVTIGADVRSGVLYAKEGDIIATLDTDGSGNVKRTCELLAGETYTYDIECYDSSAYSVMIGEKGDATGIEITYDGLEGNFGETLNLGIVSVPYYADFYGTVEWSSDNDSVATVVDGEVTFNGIGSATITAVSGNLIASVKVTCKEPEAIKLDEAVCVNIEASYASKMLSFTPEKTGTYIIYSAGDNDTVVELYDSEFNLIDSADDGGGNYESNFCLVCELEEGKTYYYIVSLYSDAVGKFNVTLSEHVTVKELKIKNPPNKTVYVKGELENTVEYEGLVVDVIWSDGSVTQWSYDNPELIGEYEMNVYCVEDALKGCIYVELNTLFARYDVEFEETGVKSLELIKGTEQVYYENVGGEIRYDYYGEEYYYYYIKSHDDAVVRVHYDDGSYTDAQIDDWLGDSWIEIVDNQYEAPFTLGENTVMVAYMGKGVPMTVKLVENPVESISVIKPSEEFYVEGIDGYYSDDWSDGEERFYYESHSHRDAVIRINYYDGTSEDVSLYDVDYVSISDNQWEEPWTVGGDGNYVIIEYMNRTVSMPVRVIENPVAGITVEQGSSVFYYEGYNGYDEIDENGNEYYHYYIADHSDAVIRIDYVDGTSKTVCVYDEIGNRQIELKDTQGENHWALGSENSLTVEFMGHQAEFPVILKENPIESIKVDPGYSITLMEHSNGYFNDDGNYYYYYSVPHDLKITVYFADGTSANYEFSDNVLGESFGCYSLQDGEPWTIGTNYAYVDLYGKIASIPVYIEENKVDRIVVNSAPTREYYMWDMEWGYSDGRYYVLSPNDLTGISFTVFYKDGTSDTYTHNDIDKNGFINGYEIMNDGELQLLSGGVYEYSFEFMGKSVSYDIKVSATNVTSMELVRLPDNKYYSSQGFASPDLTGAQIKIVYEDGTEEILNVTRDSISFRGYADSPLYYIHNRLFVCFNYENNVYEIWYNGYNMPLDMLTPVDGSIEKLEIRKFRINANGMVVGLEMEDGTTKEIKTKVMYSRVDSTVNYGAVQTDMGLMNFSVETQYNSDGSIKCYELMLAEETVEIYSVPGDCNGDMRVNGSDLALLKLYLAGANSNIDEVGGNFDCNGGVTGTDLAELKLYLAGA